MAGVGDERPGRSGLAAMFPARRAVPTPPQRGPVIAVRPPWWRRPVGILVATGVAILAVPVVSIAASSGIEFSAEATTAADRSLRVKPDGNCDTETAAIIGADNPDVDQLIVLVTENFDSTEGAAFAAVRLDGDTWMCQTDVEFARFGKAGTRPLVQRRSGDGTTPAGVFPLGTQTAWDDTEFQVFGNFDDPGLHAGLAYREVDPADCWGATPNAPTYQQLFAQPNCPGPNDEWLQRFGEVYSHAAVIGANMDPVSGDEPGEDPYAAAIFLHRHSYTGNQVDTKPTSGCVSVNQAALTELVRLLDPDFNPHFAIGPIGWLRDQ